MKIFLLPPQGSWKLIYTNFSPNHNLLNLCVPLLQALKLFLPPALLFPLKRIAFNPLGYVRSNLMEVKGVFKNYYIYYIYIWITKASMLDCRSSMVQLEQNLLSIQIDICTGIQLPKDISFHHHSGKPILRPVQHSGPMKLVLLA